MLPLPNDATGKMYDHLGSIFPLEEGLIDRFEGVVGHCQLKPKEFLLQEGEVCKHLYFVHKGLLRCFYIDRHGKRKKEREVSTWFMREKDTCVSVRSFYNQEPGKEFIQALEACELFYISYANLDRIFEESFSLNFIGRVLTVKYLVEWTTQLENLRMLTARERYTELLTRDPELVARVSQKDLASYLGVLPTSLSHMQGRTKGKK